MATPVWRWYFDKEAGSRWPPPKYFDLHHGRWEIPSVILPRGMESSKGKLYFWEYTQQPQGYWGRICNDDNSCGLRDLWDADWTGIEDQRGMLPAAQHNVHHSSIHRTLVYQYHGSQSMASNCQRSLWQRLNEPREGKTSSVTLVVDTRDLTHIQLSLIEEVSPNVVPTQK